MKNNSSIQLYDLIPENKCYFCGRDDEFFNKCQNIIGNNHPTIIQIKNNILKLKNQLIDTKIIEKYSTSFNKIKSSENDILIKSLFGNSMSSIINLQDDLKMKIPEIVDLISYFNEIYRKFIEKTNPSMQDVVACYFYNNSIPGEIKNFNDKIKKQIKEEEKNIPLESPSFIIEKVKIPFHGNSGYGSHDNIWSLSFDLEVPICPICAKVIKRASEAASLELSSAYDD